MWAIAAILMWWLGGFLGRRLGRQVLLRAFVVVPFLVALYFFYENLSRLTPTNL